MPDAPSPPRQLRERLEDTARTWIATLPSLGGYLIRERDEDGNVVPEDGPPRPVIIISAQDEGRAVKLTPIRNLRLAIVVRANSKTPAGEAASFSAIGGALEDALDTTNLLNELSGSTIAVMLATRQPGLKYRAAGFMREGTIEIECKAVKRELTNG